MRYAKGVFARCMAQDKTCSKRYHGVPRLQIVALLSLMGGPSLLLYSSFQSNNVVCVPTAPVDLMRSDEVQTEDRPPKSSSFMSYSEALSSQADDESKIVFLAFADMGGFPMAMNFYLTSIQKYNISNFLFVSSTNDFCSRFQALNVSCFVYMNESAHDRVSVYLSKDFIQKMNIRTFMVLEALNLGYHVIHTDVDMVFFKDPSERILDLCRFKDPGGVACDLAPLWDSGAHNAGFLFIRNSKASISVYEKMKHTAKTTKIDDQKALNGAMRSLKRSLRVKSLPVGEFQSGKKFFDDSHRQFAGDNPCTKCIVAHNNWIVSMEAKMYRFKEMRMWLYDPNGYYSSTQRRYLAYQNPTYFGNDPTTLAAERSSLITALAIGHILNRTVILPTFFCSKKSQRCTILKHYTLRTFDESFGNSYREHTFLQNDLVPPVVTNSSKVTCMLLNETALDPSSSENVFRFNSSQEIKQNVIEEWFGNLTASVLEFRSMYNVPRIVFQNSTADGEFREKCEKALVKAKFHQF